MDADVDLKKASKLFAQKFACGASVTKNAEGVDEITVQGDVRDEIYMLILKNYKEVYFNISNSFFIFNNVCRCRRKILRFQMGNKFILAL
jgi:hypothetical protein